MIAQALTWIEDHPGLAGWMQAIGAIVALSISVWATLHASRAAHRAASQRHALFIAMTQDIARKAEATTLKPVLEQKDIRVWATLDVAPSLELIESALTLPISEWPTTALYEAIVRLQDSLRKLRRAGFEAETFGSADLLSWKEQPVSDQPAGWPPGRVMQYAQGDVAGRVDRVMRAAWDAKRGLGLTRWYQRRHRPHGAEVRFMEHPNTRDWRPRRPH